MSLKRQPNSPMESTNKKPSYNPFETSKDKVVKIELSTINGKPYYGQVSDEELLFIWVSVFKKSRDLLFGVKSSKSMTRNVRATFKLAAPIKLNEEFPSENFSYENYLDDGATEKVVGKVLGLIKTADIGQSTKITVATNFDVEPPGVINWLSRYGAVSSKYSIVKNEETGLFTDIFETEIILSRHVHEFLPMYGQKTTISYPGIPKVCNKCYVAGHMRRECGNPERTWIEFVIDLINKEGIEPDMVGSWAAAITRYQNANAKK